MNTPKSLGLKKGDEATLRLEPVISLTQYDKLRPAASITFVVDDEDEDLRPRFKALRRLCATSLDAQLRFTELFGDRPTPENIRRVLDAMLETNLKTEGKTRAVKIRRK